MDWLVSQAPCLLQRDAADLLLAHAVRLRCGDGAAFSRKRRSLCCA